MKVLGILMMLLLVFAFTSLQDVRANEADEAYQTGLKYYNGEGDVKQDYAKALGWFRKAADRGNAKAQNVIGGMYYSGKGVTQDYQKAMKWFRKAADQGYAESQHNVGAMYQNGQGVTKDSAEAIRWLRKAADQGYQNSKDVLEKLNVVQDVRAEEAYKTGLKYYNGDGVKQDFTSAMEWFKKAADRGSADAQFRIGILYGEGQGVTNIMFQPNLDKN